MHWLTVAGAKVLGPLFTHPDYDLIADWGDRLERVQVPTSTYRQGNRWTRTYLGGPKYAKYEVDSTYPLPTRTAAPAAAAG